MNKDSVLCFLTSLCQFTNQGLTVAVASGGECVNLSWALMFLYLEVTQVTFTHTALLKISHMVKATFKEGGSTNLHDRRRTRISVNRTICATVLLCKDNKILTTAEAAVIEKSYGFRETRVLPTDDIHSLDFPYIKLKTVHEPWSQINVFH